MFGIDYSLTCPAACYYVPQDTVRFWYAHAQKVLHAVDVVVYQIVATTGERTSARAAELARACLSWLQMQSTTAVVALEDYAFNATGRVFHIGENTGILKYLLDLSAIRYEPVPPTVVKKYATGKGNADKFAMTAAFLDAYPQARSWQHELFPKTDGTVIPKSPLADMADAYWLARYAYDHLT